MIVDEGNPLIASHNAEGTEVTANKPIILHFQSVAGFSRCWNLVGFTPVEERDYELTLSGSLLLDQESCQVELRSKQLDGLDYEVDVLDFSESC